MSVVGPGERAGRTRSIRTARARRCLRRLPRFAPGPPRSEVERAPRARAASPWEGRLRFPGSLGGIHGRKIVDRDGRQRGGRVGRPPHERGHRHLSHHPVLEHGGVGRRVVRPRAPEHLGHHPGRHRDAVGRRRLGGGPRGAAGRRADDDVHGGAGAAADDPRHVQDRGRAVELLHARRRPHRGHARALDLRRPFGRDGLPADRLRAARLGLGPGGARHGPDRPGGDACARASRSCTSSTASGPRTRSPRSSS